MASHGHFFCHFEATLTVSSCSIKFHAKSGRKMKDLHHCKPTARLNALAKTISGALPNGTAPLQIIDAGHAQMRNGMTDRGQSELDNTIVTGRPCGEVLRLNSERVNPPTNQKGQHIFAARDP